MNYLSHFESFDSYVPIDLMLPLNALIAFLVIFGFIIARYFLLVGGAYFAFWRASGLGVKLHDRKLPDGQIKEEIRWSLISSVVFALSGLVLGVLWQQGLTRVYLPLDRYGLVYLPVSFIIISLIHEVYFYFTHVWMHRPRIFKIAHAVHHKSVKTSPFASFSFHPLEALVHAVFLPAICLLIPVHPLVLLSYLTLMTVTAISNHLGIELIPLKILRQSFISGEHHFIHHKRMKYNFGLYYAFMDKVMGTEAKTRIKYE